MVPVLDKNLNPLMPCKERRARTMMEKGRAKPYWKNGIFCIILQEEPSARNYQDIVIGVDPGSKREGFTVMTEHRVVMNITSNAITHVSRKVKIRKMLRRFRRERHTPYRESRRNRFSLLKSKRISPSIKSRWDAKLRIIKSIKKLLPITDVSVENVSAIPKKGSRRWNKNFFVNIIGKNYFYTEVKNLGLSLFIWTGYEVFTWRNLAEYKKISNKLKDDWRAHNVDSHCLCELIFGYHIKPISILYRLKFIIKHRRNLFKLNKLSGDKLVKYGGSISANGLKKYTLLRYRGQLYCLGGCTKDSLISLHDVNTGRRVLTKVNPVECKIVSYNLKWYLNKGE